MKVAFRREQKRDLVCLPQGLFIFGPNQPATHENALTPPQQETALKNTLQKYYSRH